MCRPVIINEVFLLILPFFPKMIANGYIDESDLLSLSLSHQMLEISASMELKANSGELTNSTDTEFSDDISFEELLAQEKKDSFWYAQFCRIAFSFFLFGLRLYNHIFPFHVQAKKIKTLLRLMTIL